MILALIGAIVALRSVLVDYIPGTTPGGVVVGLLMVAIGLGFSLVTRESDLALQIEIDRTLDRE